MVFGLVVLAAAAVALIIGQSPLILNRDYDFFLQLSRGQVLMTVVCYGFIAACWAGIAVWLTAAGIAVADLFTERRPGPENSVTATARNADPEPAR
jgi:hypothetical protein